MIPLSNLKKMIDGMDPVEHYSSDEIKVPVMNFKNELHCVTFKKNITASGINEWCLISIESLNEIERKKR